MQKKSVEILKNLGFSDESINDLKKEKIIRNTLGSLKDLGVPALAIKQIKFIESPKDTSELSRPKTKATSNQNLMLRLQTKLKRTFDTFAKKHIKMVIVFNYPLKKTSFDIDALNDDKWKIYAVDYVKPIQKLHETCKQEFDELAELGLLAFVVFDGTSQWVVKESLEKKD